MAWFEYKPNLTPIVGETYVIDGVQCEAKVGRNGQYEQFTFSSAGMKYKFPHSVISRAMTECTESNRSMASVFEDLVGRRMTVISRVSKAGRNYLDMVVV